MSKDINCWRRCRGASAAARLRRLDETQNHIVEKESIFLCELRPSILHKRLQEAEICFCSNAGEMKRFNIDVRVRNEVIAVDGENRKVKVKTI